MLPEKRFFSDGMDSDTNHRMLSDKSTLNVMNAGFGNSKYGRSLRIENRPGTTLISQSVYPPYGVHQCLGSAPDEARNRIVFINWNSSDDHGIYCFDYSDPTTPVIYAVLYDSQVIDGLGLSKNKRIDRDCKVVGDLFYWTDDLNRQRKINIEAGIKMNHASYVTDVARYDWPMNQEVISLIKRPPLLPLTITKVEQISSSIYNNFVKLFTGQFAYRYYYRDGETSVLSTYSTLANYNASDELFNRIDIVVPFNEYIDQDVQRVDLVKRIGNTNNYEVIFSWNKDIPSQAAQIVAHNAGTTQLTYNFYNDRRGEALGASYALKPFDSVPRRSKSLEYARGRILLGNNLIGYDTPTETSLSAAFRTSTEGATNQAVWWRFGFSTMGSPDNRYMVYVDTAGLAYNGWYEYNPYTSLSWPYPIPLPDTVAYATLVFIGSTASDAEMYLRSTWGATGALIFSEPVTFEPIDITAAPFTTSLVGNRCFKTDAPYQIGIVFYDFADRKSGVLTSDSLIYRTPDRAYDTIAYTTALNWTLSNTNALAEIPEWATHFSIVINKCLRTRFFMQSRVTNLTYATKDADGEYVFNTSAYAATNAGVAVDLRLLVSNGMGYTYTQGDLIKLYLDGSGTIYTLSIVAQSGNWIICELADLGAIGDTGSPYTTALFEIYTPYQPLTSEPYFEVGQTYLISNPGTALREYNVTTGSIGGDVTLLERDNGSDTYLTENMSPNDTFYTVWDTDAGRLNLVTNIGESEEPNTIAYSNVYVVGTSINGLSSFDALDEKNVPNECGAISKLQLTSKVSEQGTVLLAICEKETASLYLSELQLVGAAQNAFIASAPEVIGTINSLKGSYGTTQKSSVHEYKGAVRFIDVLNSSIVEYSVNGLEPVSRYNQERFFERYCSEFLEATNGNLDNINGFHHIPSCVDPFHKEFVVTLPALIYENYADVLPSYSGVVPSYATSIINRFDLFDRLGKTMAYQFNDNKWGQNFEYMGEWYENLQNTLFAWKNGQIYIHNSDTTNWNRFYGTDYPIRLCLTGNLNPSALKVLNNTSIESNLAPDYTVAMTQHPNEQITDLTVGDYTDEEGFYYADFFKDRMSPNASGLPDERLYTGDDLTDVVFLVMYEWQAYNQLFWCNFINISYSLSRGQKAITTPINT